MINAAEIYLWRTKIGTIWRPDNEVSAVFEYDKAFLNSGIEVSPFMMPLSEKLYRFPELSKLESFRGLPGLLADSLPDNKRMASKTWSKSRKFYGDREVVLYREKGNGCT